MKKVSFLAEYSDIIKNTRRKYDKMIYNVMLLPDEIERLIGYGRFYYEEVDGGVIFYDDELDFYKLYCHLDISATVHITSRDKPQIVEFIGSTVRTDRKVEALREKFEESGIEKYVTNMRVRTSAKRHRLSEEVTAEWPSDMFWGYATSDDKPALYDIWQSLDKYDSIIPRENELDDLIDKKAIVCIYQQSNICATAKIRRENTKTDSYWLVTVDPNYRRRGIATKMYDLLLSLTEEGGREFGIQWCDISNSSIIAVTDKFGFEPDGAQSVEYIIY